MICTECRKQLGEYAEGKLTGPAAEALAEHLKSCVSCREELDGLRLALSAMRSLRPVEPPEWLLGAISDAVDRAQPGTRARRWSWQQMSAVALAACVLVGFAVVLRPGGLLGGPGGVPLPGAPTAGAIVAAQRTSPAEAGTKGVSTVDEPGRPEEATRTGVEERTAEGPRHISATTRGRHTGAAARHGVQTPRGAGPVQAPRSIELAEGPATPLMAPKAASIPPLAGVLPGSPEGPSATLYDGAPTEPLKSWDPEAMGSGMGRGPTEPAPGSRLVFGASGLGGGPAAPAMCAAGRGTPEVGEGLDVQFIPPRERLVGREAVALLALRPTRSLSAVEVRVEPARGMKVSNATDGGLVFDSPLDGGRRVTVPLRLVAQEEGRQEMLVTVRTEPPDGSTRLDVAMPGFGPASDGASEIDMRLRRNVTLNVVDGEVREALQTVGRGAGIDVEVSPSVGDARVSVDLQDIPAEAALRLLCQDAQLRMMRESGGVRVYRP